MKNVFVNIISVVAAIVVTILLMRQCSPTKGEIIERVTVDTVYTEEIIRDTVVEIIEKPVFIVEYKEVEVPKIVEVRDSSERIYTYSESYLDSAIEIAGNIRYEGTILQHDQMLIEKKEKITFIPSTRTIFTTRNITRTLSKKPRVSVGAYITANKFNVEQLGVSVLIQDNKYRNFLIGKDVLNTYGFMAGVNIPLFYSK